MTEGIRRQANRVTERIVVTGKLVLETPARFGSEDGSALTDMPLLRDPLDGSALLTGATLAGGLRNYLREREHGFGNTGNSRSLYRLLFGDRLADGDAAESALIIDDGLSALPRIELRDGVAIDGHTRTAKDKHKFDVELLEAGTSFPLRLELLAGEGQEAVLVRALAIALQGLERGEIALGSRKRRGFGECRVTEWAVCRYRMSTPEGLIGWLEDNRGAVRTGRSIATLLGLQEADVSLDERRAFELEATFAVDGSLLIRSGAGGPADPDAVQLRSARPGNSTAAVLSGTSLAGALRARALRIAKLMCGAARGPALVEGMFGAPLRREGGDSAAGEPDGAAADVAASRLVVSESEIVAPLDLVHTRVKIDRFTGGAYPGALFSEQPVFGHGDGSTRVKVRLRLRQAPGAPFDPEVGLLLLLLKDLWTGDLPLGGEAAVGRGRLRGVAAALRLGEKQWAISEGKAALEITGDREDLEAYVRSLAEVER